MASLMGTDGNGFWSKSLVNSMGGRVSQVMDMMTMYYHHDVKRINHFTKVYGYAKYIGEMEGLQQTTQEILEIAALTHDIGIKISEEKYHSSAGRYQEQEGPSVAMAKLTEIGIPEGIINRVCFLIGHHHTYSAIDGQDFQILVEADFIVNIHEESLSVDAIRSIAENVFKTKTGLALLGRLYL